MMFDNDYLKDSPLKTPRADPMGNMMPLFQGPFIKTPITDVFAPLNSTQEGPTFCANMEMSMLNCLEQYGYRRGVKMCGGYIADLSECQYKLFERMRNDIMREERRRQYLAGERKERYEKTPPPL